MEKIGFISSIIAFLIGIGFIFFSNKSEQNDRVENKKSNEKKKTEERALLPILLLLFVVAYLLSLFYHP